MTKPKKPEPRPYLVARTPNGRDIQKLLASSKKDPREYKDWVVLKESQLMDWLSTYNVTRTLPNNATESFDFGVMLVHKSELHRFIGELAERWWHRKLGRRVQQKGPKG